MSLRTAINAPFAQILVGESLERFFLPVPLLSKASTYFNAALNGGFSEAESQTITLQSEDVDVFRTFAAWLYREELICEELQLAYKNREEFEDHLVTLYVFADCRGIKSLQDDACAMLLSFLLHVHKPARLSTIDDIYALSASPRNQYTRKMLVLDELYHEELRIKSCLISQFPPEFTAEILQEVCTNGKPTKRPSDPRCTYMEHDGGVQSWTKPREGRNQYRRRIRVAPADSSCQSSQIVII